MKKPEISDSDMPHVEEFEPLAYVGSGGQGDVWKARHVSGDVVAIKFQSPAPAPTAKCVERFTAEAEIEHRHGTLGPLAIQGEVRGRQFFTMEWVEGISLKELSDSSAIGYRDAARYLRDVARDLVKRGDIVHRDIKPSNIIIAKGAEGYDDRARLMDYGIARDLTREIPLTSAGGAFLGTFEYMSPEQILRKQVDQRSDIFCIGVVLYELLAAVNPFFADTHERRAAKIVHFDHRTLPPEVPRDLRIIVDKCLAKKPEGRIQSAKELADELDRYLSGQPIRSRPESALSRTVRYLKPHGGWAAAALLLGAASVAAIVPDNEFVARSAAGDALGFFYRWARSLEVNAYSPALLGAIENRDGEALQGLMRKLCGGADLPGTSGTLLNETGVLTARCPEKPELLGTKYDYRDYFLGPLRRTPEDSPHVSRIYQSTIDNSVRFALSVAIRNAAGVVVGVLAAARVASESFDKAFIEKARGFQLVVVGSWDPAQPPNPQSVPPADARGVVIMHPSFKKPPSTPQALKDDFGAVADRASRWFKDRSDRAGGDLERWDESDSTWYWDDLDSVPLKYLPWRAGLAPIGHTGLVVIVRSRWQLGFALAFASSALVFAAGAWSRQKKRQNVALFPPQSVGW